MRYASGSTPTKYQFTGQYSFAGEFGLLDFKARYYDPQLGRFAAADTIIPQGQGVQAWDRYAGMLNNPVRYTDVTGHMVDDGCGRGECGEWKPKSNSERRDYLFSLMFLGSGKDGAWKTSDWNYYYDKRADLWGGKTQWKNPDSETGWDLFALHVERLASHYRSNQTEQFMRDFGLVFAGISAIESWHEAAWDARNGPTQPFLHEGNVGLSPQYLDSLDPTANQSHHYAGILFMAYFAGGLTGALVNFVRDPNNAGDINLGTEAARHGAYLLGPTWNTTIYDLPNWIDYLSP